ncbi:T9SS type A sorting domain-containing protein [Halosquirtibacter laminarini]|uniref:T9SS type A sorting domain-containing protein n=1 Tax=Halosquirtibacter laminarini TaxID=3374600 RepID=A0AC61NDQ3_9BACT|nr:T9SS type A sorting domain-containing protein [Prolixibacteraceae bacterium]
MKKIYAFIVVLVFVLNAEAQNRFQLIAKIRKESREVASFIQEDVDTYKYFNGYFKDRELQNFGSIYAVVDQVVYTFKSGVIWGYSLQDGENVFKSDVLGVTSTYPSFLKYSRVNNSLYLGFTVYGDKEDYVYRLNLTNKNWIQVAKLPCNFDLDIFGDKIYISGLGYSNWNGKTDKNSIWMMPIDGSSELKKIIEIPGNSCGLAISSNGSIVCGSYDLANNSFGIYMWPCVADNRNKLKGRTLTIEDAVCIATLPCGIYDCVFDKYDNLYWNMNSYSATCSVVKWDGESPAKYIKVAEAPAGTWFTTLLASSGNNDFSLWADSFMNSPVKISHKQKKFASDSEAAFKPNFATKLIEYCPAPGQFVNTSAFGTKEVAEKTLGHNMINPFGRKIVTLGAWGGYIVYGFDRPIVNDKDNPYGVDFTLIGNTFFGSAEPGIVKVMKDVNGNGKADDQWYELRGSDHYLKTTKTNYSITYTNPRGLKDVPYVTSDGESGVIKYMVAFHKQNHYPLPENFPNISQDEYTLEGTRLKSRTSIKNFVINAPFDYGYVDNVMFNAMSNKSYIPDNPYTFEVQENYGGDAFDINWAVDKDGNHVKLDQIDFVAVYNGVLQNGAALGEVSTEVGGVCATKPDPSIKGVTECIVSSQPANVGNYPVQDRGEVYLGSPYKFDAVVLSYGVPADDQKLNWKCSDKSIATISNEGFFNGLKAGEVTVTCTWSKKPDIERSFVVLVSQPKSTPVYEPISSKLYAYPNPTTNEFKIKGTYQAKVSIYNCVGTLVGVIPNYQTSEIISLQNMPSGVYYIEVSANGVLETIKVIKN